MTKTKNFQGSKNFFKYNPATDFLMKNSLNTYFL